MGKSGRRCARPLVFVVVDELSDELSAMWNFREGFFMGTNTPSRPLTLVEYAAECERYWVWRRSVGHHDSPSIPARNSP